MENSRIFVKGLPKYYTKNSLKKHFEQFGEITDVGILLKEYNIFF